jgi:hypothetical protein
VQRNNTTSEFSILHNLEAGRLRPLQKFFLIRELTNAIMPVLYDDAVFNPAQEASKEASQHDYYSYYYYSFVVLARLREKLVGA